MADTTGRTDVRVAGYLLPAGATDAHSHVIGPVSRYPFAAGRSYTPAEAHLGDYRRMLASLGLTRSVIVQPSFYGTDNSCTLDAVAALGTERARAVVMAEDLSGPVLEDLHRRGARGVRFITMVHGGQSIDALNNGRPFSGRPSLGSWMTYGLGSESRNLPAFVVLTDDGLPVLGAYRQSSQ